ncbi:hypothetical protein NDQ40_10030, partial [Alcaligenes faecalis]|nr:hypothetical protein [Alcaligenes faecalis]
LRPEASQRFEHAYQRIYTPTYLAWDGQWTLIFSMPSLMMNSKRFVWGFSIFKQVCLRPAAFSGIRRRKRRRR